LEKNLKYLIDTKFAFLYIHPVLKRVLINLSVLEGAWSRGSREGGLMFLALVVKFAQKLAPAEMFPIRSLCAHLS
jgi:hypothetical protein